MKTINFIQRTYQEIITAYTLLKLRYKTVRFFKTLSNGYFFGYFEVVKQYYCYIFTGKKRHPVKHAFSNNNKKLNNIPRC